MMLIRNFILVGVCTVFAASSALATDFLTLEAKSPGQIYAKLVKKATKRCTKADSKFDKAANTVAQNIQKNASNVIKLENSLSKALYTKNKSITKADLKKEKDNAKLLKKIIDKKNAKNALDCLFEDVFECFDLAQEIIELEYEEDAIDDKHDQYVAKAIAKYNQTVDKYNQKYGDKIEKNNLKTDAKVNKLLDSAADYFADIDEINADIAALGPEFEEYVCDAEYNPPSAEQPEA